jgi:hypothetical protein
VTVATSAGSCIVPGMAMSARYHDFDDSPMGERLVLGCRCIDLRRRMGREMNHTRYTQ